MRGLPLRGGRHEARRVRGPERFYTGAGRSCGGDVPGYGVHWTGAAAKESGGSNRVIT